MLLLQDFVELGGVALGGDENDRPNRQKTKDKNGGERQQRPNALCQPSVDKIGGEIGGVENAAVEQNGYRQGQLFHLIDDVHAACHKSQRNDG